MGDCADSSLDAKAMVKIRLHYVVKFSRAVRAYKRFIDRRPLVSNCLTYGSMAALAEFTQQTIEGKLWLENSDSKDYDWLSISRYGAIGSFVLSPVLYAWYRWLDTRFPARTGAVIAKKVILDSAILGMPLYSSFYIGMAFLEGKRGSQMFEEWKSKVLPTFVLSCCFWIPAQAINFRLISPNYRVSVIGCLTFIELNFLCLFRRIDF